MFKFNVKENMINYIGLSNYGIERQPMKNLIQAESMYLLDEQNKKVFGENIVVDASNKHDYIMTFKGVSKNKNKQICIKSCIIGKKCLHNMVQYKENEIYSVFEIP